MENSIREKGETKVDDDTVNMGVLPVAVFLGACALFACAALAVMLGPIV